MQLALREHIRTNTSDVRNHLERMEFGDVWSHDVCLKCSLDQMRPLPTPTYANVTFKILATHIAKQLVALGPLFSSRFPKPFRLKAEFVAAKDPEDPGSLGQARLLGTGWYKYHAVSWYPLVSQLVSGRCGVVVDLEQLRSMIHQ